MRVSGEEFLRLSQLRPGRAGAGVVAAGAGVLASAPLYSSVAAPAPMDLHLLEEAHHVADRLHEQGSDVREDVVASLRARVESGSYQVSGEQVAEMMIRRLIADRIR